MISEGHVVRAVRLVGDERCHDIGNFESYFKAFIDFALEDEEYGDLVDRYLRQKLQ
jgi:UTP--glucose-1-phosphate uridylyltransferase